jgi:putative peptide zinc metalloprotease protein
VLEWQIGAKGLNAELLERSRVTEQEYQTVLEEYHGLMEQKAKLDLAAPVAGKAVDLAEGFQVGSWVAPKTRLAAVIDPQNLVVEAYVDESDLDRIAPGGEATFSADADARISVALEVTEIARASVRTLPDPALASTYGGPIPVRTPKRNELVPDPLSGDAGAAR